MSVSRDSRERWPREEGESVKNWHDRIHLLEKRESIMMAESVHDLKQIMLRDNDVDLHRYFNRGLA